MWQVSDDIVVRVLGQQDFTCKVSWVRVTLPPLVSALVSISLLAAPSPMHFVSTCNHIYMTQNDSRTCNHQLDLSLCWHAFAYAQYRSF